MTTSPTPPRHVRSIATVSLSGTLVEKLEAAAAAGFDGVELFENDLLTFGGSPADVRRVAASLGLAITLYQPFRDFEAMPEPVRRRNLDRAERKFDVMQELGTDLVLVCSNVHPDALDDDARAGADLAEMAERAMQRGLRVGYEALAWGRYVNRWGHAWKIVREAAHPALGLILDSFHTLAVGDDLAGIAELPGDRIFFVQLADAPQLEIDLLSWSRHFRNFPGQGQLAVERFLAAVVATGYRGPLSLEIFNDAFRAAPATQIARDGMRSLIWAASEAGCGERLADAPSFDGFEFLEFAVDDESAQRLTRFLHPFGFHRAGRHRSKAVDLYRNGRINLVLNHEQDSAAAEHFELHGPSVCAVALRVDDAAAAIERATALLAPEWSDPIGAGERRIPAIRAPDGMLIYLVEPDASGRSIFEDDFCLVGDELGDELLDIDHVTQALPHASTETFVLFYRAVLGLQSEQLGEVADPHGLIVDRTMMSANRRLGIHLNVSQSRTTATGRFISATAGAGIQHVAFATDDVVAATEHIRERGGTILPIPANYYADLAARWDVDAALLATLQGGDLLYDRDEAGELIHAYTDTFDDRYFFELVERRGYRHSGSVNAAVRLASQAARLSAKTA
jgi:4-hydroxyphenylpyruvate dioxygenase